MTRDLLVPCENEACEHLTAVRVYGATRDDPGYESTDSCSDCGWPLDFEDAADDDGYDDPAL